MKYYFYLNSKSGLCRQLNEETFFKMLDTIQPRLICEKRYQRIMVGGSQDEFVLIERNYLYE